MGGHRLQRACLETYRAAIFSAVGPVIAEIPRWAVESVVLVLQPKLIRHRKKEKFSVYRI